MYVAIVLNLFFVLSTLMCHPDLFLSGFISLIAGQLSDQEIKMYTTTCYVMLSHVL